MFEQVPDYLVDIATVVTPLLVLTLLIFIHELGHFTAARMVGVRVEEFAIGFGPRLVQKKIGHTVYAVRAFLLGGFVQMYGDLDPSSSVKNQSLRNNPDSLLSKTLAQKIFVLAAGVVMNFILGVILFVVYLSVVEGMVAFKRIGDYQFIGGQEYPKLVTLSQDFRDTEADYGFILSLNGEIIHSRSELVSILAANENKLIQTEIQTQTGSFTREFVLNGDGIKSNLDLDVFPHGDAGKSSLARPYISEIDTSKGVFHQAKIANTSLTLPDGRTTYLTVADKQTEFIKSYILSLGEENINTPSKLNSAYEKYQGQEVEMRLVTTSGKIQIVTVKLPQTIDPDQPVLGVKLNYTTMGFSDDFFLYRYSDPLSGGLLHAINTTGYQGYALGVLIGRALDGRPEELTDNVGGVVEIGQQIGGVVSEASKSDKVVLIELLNITATISLVLAFMNILPIPVLDGGHILFAVLEKLRGKPLPPQIENTIYLIFFVLLIFLSILVTGRGFYNLFF